MNTYTYLPKANWWERLKLAYRIVVHSEVDSLPDWYEKLKELVESDYSRYASKSVSKSDKEFASLIGTQEIRKKEALQWMRHYAEEGGSSTDIPAWKSHFLIEWNVLRKKGLL